MVVAVVLAALLVGGASNDRPSATTLRLALLRAVGSDDADASDSAGTARSGRRYVTAFPRGSRVKEAIELGEVEFVDGEVDPLNVEICNVPFLLRRVVVVGETLKSDDLMTAADQLLAEMRPDETRRSCNAVSHERAPIRS